MLFPQKNENKEVINSMSGNGHSDQLFAAISKLHCWFMTQMKLLHNQEVTLTLKGTFVIVLQKVFCVIVQSLFAALSSLSDGQGFHTMPLHSRDSALQLWV